MLFYLELDPNQIDEDLTTFDLYLKDNQTIITKQQYTSTIISIYIFKIEEGEYKKEMNDMKSIVSLMTKASVRKESIGIKISDSFWDDMEMFFISINLKLA